MFVHLFGISWEALVILHRWLGYLFVLCVAAHMFTWWYVFAEQNYFPYDIFHLIVHYPAYHPTGPACADNFTVPLIELTTFVLFIVFGVLTFHKIRRMKFEWFYWTHHFFLSVFIAVILHAASAWYFILGGLFLWFVDRLFRLYNTSRRVEVLDMRICPECTQLTLFVQENDIFCRAGKQDFSMNWNMGQYLFINIPNISPLEWHPFSIASAPTDLYPSVFIKDMGEGTFTNKVNQYAKAVESDGSFSELVVNVDGPYGLPLDWERFRRIIIIAGGIGITPCHSIFRGLYFLRKMGQADVSRVYLIWAARSKEMFAIDAFADTFQRVDRNSQDGIFHYSLFVTQKQQSNGADGDSKKPTSPKFKTGRFDISDELRNMETNGSTVPLNDDQVHQGRPSFPKVLSFLTPTLDQKMKPVSKSQDHETPRSNSGRTSRTQRSLSTAPSSTSDILVFTCGPEGLVQSAQDFAYQIGASFHAETFFL